MEIKPVESMRSLAASEEEEALGRGLATCYGGLRGYAGGFPIRGLLEGACADMT